MGNMLSNKFDLTACNYQYIIVNKQLVFYEITDDVIEIIRILDGRTDYLSHLL
ncbi:MAG: hypothetical protein IJR70_06935 [Eubacterium sp.]|nr:hypothetical protein [Eubacterium sp.]